MGKTFRHTHRDADSEHDERLSLRQQRQQERARERMSEIDAMPVELRFARNYGGVRSFVFGHWDHDPTEPTFNVFKASRR